MHFEIAFTCPLPNGIHARPASVFEELCKPLQAQLHLENLRNGQRASLRSVLGLISADVAYGDNCKIVITGEGAEQARDVLEQFIEQDLAHCDDKLEPVATAQAFTLPAVLKDAEPVYLSGQAASPGTARGQALIMTSVRFADFLSQLQSQGLEQEWQQLKQALLALQHSLKQQYDNATAIEKDVLKAHLAIVTDEEFTQRLRLGLSSAESTKATSACAITSTIDYFDELLGNSENPYLRERALDIQDICAQLMRAVYGDQAVISVDAPQQPSVIIAHSLTPSDFIAFNNGNLTGVVLENGGKTSHTVILARAAGIPVVVGVQGASEFCTAQNDIIVDADLGIIIRQPNERVERYYTMQANNARRLQQRFEPFKHTTASTRDGQRVEVAANIAAADEAQRAFAQGAEGIGLFRTEMLFMDRSQAPSEQEQFDAYQQTLLAAGGKPVIIRTFDVGGDKPISYFNIKEEENPFLGYRAVRTYPEFNDIFTTQLRALVRASVAGPLRIMIPMISCVEEIRWVKAQLDQLCQQLREQQIDYGSVELGMMLEVPAAAFAITHCAQYVDFFSIGSNDLAQYFLACDRGNERLNTLYSNYHPAFIRLLNQVVKDIHGAGRWVGLCGEMAADEQLLPVLAGLGLDEISMGATNIARSKAAIAALDSKACAALVQRLMDCADIDAVKTALTAFRSADITLPVIDKTLITLQGDAISKAEVIKLQVDNLLLNERTDNAASLEQAIWQREEMFTTGLGFGIAVPHCKSASVTHNSISLMRLENPVEWGSHDGVGVDTIFMLTIRDTDDADVHMKIFAQLARSIMHEQFRETLRACTDEQAALDFLTTALKL